MQLASKNLIPYPYVNQPTTITGITFTYNSDGTVTADGTATSNVYNWIIPSQSGISFAAGKYTMSGCPSGGSTTTYYLSDGNSLNDTGNGSRTTYQTDGKRGVCICILKDTTVSNLVFKPQIERGLITFPTYSPYISNFVSSNLFDISNVYSPLDTDTYEISNNTLKVYRNRSYVVGVVYHILLPVGTQYTLHYDIEYGGTATGIYNFADSKNFAGRLNHVTYTGTVGDTGYLRLEFSRIGGGNDKLGWVTYSNIEVEFGSTATDGAIKVSCCGKNLLPYPWVETTKTQNGITFTDNGDGSLTISGTTTAETNFILQRGRDYGSQPINAITTASATNGKYTVSKRIFYNANSKVTSVNFIKNATVNETIYPQVELGITATTYEPYQGQTASANETGAVSGITSLYPLTTLMTNNTGALIAEVEEYDGDILKTVESDLTPVFDTEKHKAAMYDSISGIGRSIRGEKSAVSYESKKRAVPLLAVHSQGIHSMIADISNNIKN